MSRPAQLEAQKERVKEIQEALAKGENLNEPVTEPVVEGTPSTEPPTEPVTEPVVSEPPATISKDEYNKLEQRYRTLQGMHNAETSRLRGEVANVTAALQDVENRLIAAEKATKAPVAPVKYVTEEDEKEYGDTLDMVRRAAREEAELAAQKREEAYLERIAQLEARFGRVESTVVPTVENLTKAQLEQTKADYWGAIQTQVPNWRTINDNPDFKAWLLAADPVTGANRQQFLSQAHAEYNAPRVILFFKEWERSQAGGPTPAPRNPQTDLERLVAPGASKGTGAVGTPEKKKWTSDDVNAFYKDVHTGKYADRAEERKKIEADIFLAQKEGRYIRG